MDEAGGLGHAAQRAVRADHDRRRQARAVGEHGLAVEPADRSPHGDGAGGERGVAQRAVEVTPADDQRAGRVLGSRGGPREGHLPAGRGDQLEGARLGSGHVHAERLQQPHAARADHVSAGLVARERRAVDERDPGAPAGEHERRHRARRPGHHDRRTSLRGLDC